MSDVTEADREKAASVMTGDVSYYVVRDAIAAALAEEREKARAPFLAEAAKLDERAAAMYDDKRAEGEITTNEEELLADAFHHCADRIRRAAEAAS